MSQQNDGKNNGNEIVGKRKITEDEENPSKKRTKSSIPGRKLPLELLYELFASLPLEIVFAFHANMPNVLLANIVQKVMKVNKWNMADCGPKLNICPYDGVTVRHFGPIMRNCVRSIMSIPPFNLKAKKPTILFFYEVQILNWYQHIEFGFCTSQFPLKYEYLGSVKNSIGLRSRRGLHIDGFFKDFKHGDAGSKELKKKTKYKNCGKLDYNANGPHFEGGNWADNVGLGIVNSPANLPMKCFATYNGQFLGMAELPSKFFALKMFPAVTLCFHRHEPESISANFGKQKWDFEHFNDVLQLCEK